MMTEQTETSLAVAVLLPDVAARLDRSPESLDVLEAWLLSAFASREDALRPACAGVLQAASHYVGETLRHWLGGRWQLQPGDSRHAFAGLAVVGGFDNRLAPLCPQALILSALEQRTGRCLTTLLYFRMRYGRTGHIAGERRRHCRICEG